MWLFFLHFSIFLNLASFSLLIAGVNVYCSIWPHSDTPHPVGLLQTTDQSEAGTSTYNTHNRQTAMPPVGFEPTIPACDWPQTHALDRGPLGWATWLLPLLILFEYDMLWILTVNLYPFVWKNNNSVMWRLQGCCKTWYYEWLVTVWRLTMKDSAEQFL